MKPLIVLLITLAIPGTRLFLPQYDVALAARIAMAGTPDGPGARYLWFRVPLQGLFIAWVYFSAVSPVSL